VTSVRTTTTSSKPVSTTTSVRTTTGTTTSVRTSSTTTKTGVTTTAGGSTTTAPPTSASGNPFAGKQIYANPYYASEIQSLAIPSLPSSLVAKASAVAKLGTFVWL
jgi:cellulose 1,4-beta-cellobiosidase